MIASILLILACAAFITAMTQDDRDWFWIGLALFVAGVITWQVSH